MAFGFLSQIVVFTGCAMFNAFNIFFRYPRKVTKRMAKKKIKMRSKIKPFLKVRPRFNNIKIGLFNA